jgi:hypothetical protein
MMPSDEYHADLENLLNSTAFKFKMGRKKVFFICGFVKHIGEESISLISELPFCLIFPLLLRATEVKKR